MDIFRINELTDEMIFLAGTEFLDFLTNSLGEDISDLFRVQGIRDMTSLSLTTIDELTRILHYEVTELNSLKRKLGFTLDNGIYEIRLGVRRSIDRLLLLVKSKVILQDQGFDFDGNDVESDMGKKLFELWKEQRNSSDEDEQSILFALIKNIEKNFKRTKNHYSYNEQIQNFALSVFIFGGRNSYEFLRLNLPGALPHGSTIESLIRQRRMKMTECEFRFDLLQEHLQASNTEYAFCSEDSTRVICRIEYDSQSNSFIGFSSALNNGLPQVHSFKTNDFEQLRS